MKTGYIGSLRWGKSILMAVLGYILIQISPVTGLEWPRGFQEVKVPKFHDNGT